MEHPLTLEGIKVSLVPLEQSHFYSLASAAANDEIWRFFYFNGADAPLLKAHLQEALILRDAGFEYPFAVIDKETDAIIGSTRFQKMAPEHRSLEIGMTWYKQEYWGKGYNDECKLLLLTHCFEQLKTVRVMITAWEKNIRSCRAIERVGGRFEGILRKALVRNGEPRNIVYYSILDDEWPDVKASLRDIIDLKYSLLRTRG